MPMDLEKRMEELEKSLQRNKWTMDHLQKRVRLYQRVGLAVSCVVTVLAMLVVWPGAKVIEAEKFVLRDAEGKIRGKWQVDKNGPFSYW
jgi:hypothetical protein